jgi:hypothetical protein
MGDVTITPSRNGPHLVTRSVRLTDVAGREIPDPETLHLR